MRVIVGAAQRGPVLASGILFGSIALLGVSLQNEQALKIAAPTVALAVVVTTGYRTLLRWRALVASVILVILFIPIRRYSMPVNLPFDLEPYRVLVAFVAGGWLASLLVDPRVRFRRSPLQWPLLVYALASLVSVVFNTGRISSLGVNTDVTKALTFLVSFLLVFFVIVSVVKTKHDVDVLVQIIVGGAAVVGFFAVVESLTHYNVFDHLAGAIPFLRAKAIPYSLLHPGGTRLRVYASAQHPIALGAALTMLLPLGGYLARRPRAYVWRAACVLITFGAFATVSRTAVLMLLAGGFVFLWLRPKSVRRLWPLLLPTLLAVHIALPGTVSGFKEGFFPKGGLIAQQQGSAGGRGSGRIADIGPSLHEYWQRPLVGEGFGTRVVDLGRANALILDDQWLTTLLETGIFGAVAWLWVIVRSCRRLGRASRADDSERGFLYAALAASIVAFGVGMLTYDAFSFIQVTLLFFILLALGAALLQAPREASHAP